MPATERQRDRWMTEGQRLATVAIQPSEHLGRAGRERARVVLGSLLEQQDVHPALGEFSRCDGAAGTGTDDARVDLDDAAHR